MADGLPGLPPPGQVLQSLSEGSGLPGLPPPGFLSQAGNEDRSPWADAFVSGANSALFGFGDEAAAGVRSVIPGYGSYDDELNAIRGGMSEFAKEHPVADTMATIGGSLATLPFGGAAAKGGSLASTIGRSAATGGAMGAAYGFGEGEGGFGERAQSAAEGGLTSALMSPLAVAIPAAVKKSGASLKKAAQDLNRKSLGLSYQDYARSAADIGTVELPSGDITTKAKEAIDDLLNKGVFGKTREPSKLLAISRKEQQELGKTVSTIINTYDEKVKIPVVPTFKEAMDVIESGKIPADEIDTYIKKLGNIESNIKREGQGKLSYLQQQKVAIGEKWNPNDSAANKFNRAVYSDLQRTIEDVVPSVKPLNAEIQKHKYVEPALKRGLAKSENADPASKLARAFFTTGGFGTPLLAGAYSGFPILGTAASLGLAAANSPGGQRAFSGALNKAGNVASGAGGMSPAMVRMISSLSSPGPGTSPSLGTSRGSTALNSSAQGQYPANAAQLPPSANIGPVAARLEGLRSSANPTSGYGNSQEIMNNLAQLLSRGGLR